MKLLIKLLVACSLAVSSQAFAEVSVIVNKANTDSLDAEELKKIYLGKMKSFHSGEKVEVYALDSSNETTQEFQQKVLNKSNSQYKSYWSKLVFTGKGIPPKELANANEIIEQVSKNTNAIGFVETSEVTGDVKVVAKF